MKKLFLLSLTAVLTFACSGKTERQTARIADGLTYHPSPETTGDCIPATPVTTAPIRSPRDQKSGSEP